MALLGERGRREGKGVDTSPNDLADPLGLASGVQDPISLLYFLRPAIPTNSSNGNRITIQGMDSKAGGDLVPGNIVAERALFRVGGLLFELSSLYCVQARTRTQEALHPSTSSG